MNKAFPFVGRKKARRYAVQALYGWLLSDNNLREIEKHVLAERVTKNFDKDYFLDLLHGIPKQTEEIDALMMPYVNRKFEDLGPIELTILRIGIYELKEKLEIPYKVVINEALELAKTFAAPDSHKFVNGVLDKVAKQLRRHEN